MHDAGPEKNSEFTFQPSEWLPFRDKVTLDRVRKIDRHSIEMHRNPDLRIRVVPDSVVEFAFVSDMFYRIWRARAEDRNVVLLVPNPSFAYEKLAWLINRFRIPCDHLYTFNVDEYADDEGNVAPESYPQGFLRAIKSTLFAKIDSELRPPEQQIVGFTNDNISSYADQIEQLGGADACYTGPGWTGHIAFIEPGAPEFSLDLEEWKRMGPRLVTLSPFTIAQNSLHGSFGASGDLSAVPPRAVTVGPAQIVAAKYRMDMHALRTGGTLVSWQRFVTRLVLHGPVTPLIPTSILQEVGGDAIVAESAAMNIEPIWDLGY
jgi:glucosamine-6-phosphate deaminase